MSCTRKYFVTSESVTEGHPDKLCDQISDAILDAYLLRDDQARVACETTCTTGCVNIMGEITSSALVNIPRIVRNVVNNIGYTNSDIGFDGNTCSVCINIDNQSLDIAQGVDHCLEARTEHAYDSSFEFDLGAGDQGMVYGYACNETPEFMPLPISIAHKLAKKLSEVRKDKTLDYLRPDGKTQVTIEYHDGVPTRIDTIVVSTQHDPDVTIDKITQDLRKYVIDPVVSTYHISIDSDTKVYINPTGRFVIGGPQGDTGLTGRKIVVDTYGGIGRVGGGAFSGKDPTKVDRSAAYAARWVAKNVVAAGLADKCEVQISYAIGVANPVSIMIDTFGTSTVSESIIEEAVKEVFDLRPRAIIKSLNLNHIKYLPLAAYGHMGREELDVPWENVDKDEELLYHVDRLNK